MAFEYTYFSKKAFAISLEVVKAYEQIDEKRKSYPYCVNFLNTGTSIAAYVEAGANNDVIEVYLQRMKTAYFTCKEARYWTRLLFELDLIPKEQYELLVKEMDHLISHFSTYRHDFKPAKPIIEEHQYHYDYRCYCSD